MLNTQKQKKNDRKILCHTPLSKHNFSIKSKQINTLNTVLSHYFNIHKSDLYASTRKKASIALIRQIAMYICHVNLSLTYTEIGAIFGRDRTTASYACRLIEDKRDNPSFDSLIARIERIVTHTNIITKTYSYTKEVNNGYQ